MLPMNQSYNTPEKVVDNNEIIGALFLGGILVKTIDLTKLHQGYILEGVSSNFFLYTII
ncbi:hypothetical protein [Aliarcobacter butzleri]|uniref:hypothetical protein n=1 Tax=Aliarcobacter butzleri TaxID=28197 RepID=UPI0006599108|nr:hypothetical protein [Aliarcobacter butzleri]KLD98296.1 hypothetical protein AF74_03515 [Aliarcobacter butzleri L349]